MNRRQLVITSVLSLATMAGGGTYWKNRWKHIVIHHSAGSFGDIPFLQKVHKQRQADDPINAIPYHFIIGNGNGLAMGEIASDWRQKYALWGAHVSLNNFDHNFRGLGICLIGNFEKSALPELQYQSLLKLTKQLMQDHNIAYSNVNGHGMIRGESTQCPGKFFPIKRFRHDLRT